MRKTKWTRERILREILERETKGLPLSAGRAMEPTMYRAASRIFGSWRHALQAAGIPTRQALAKGKWPPAQVLVFIRKLARRRRPLGVVELEQRYGSMVTAARRIFGSFPKAVMAAGISPTKFQRVVPWTRERIIEAILTRALRNEPLAARFVKPRSLVEAGQRLFGRWATAIEAAGLDPKGIVVPRETQPRRAVALTPAGNKEPGHKPRQLWTKEMVIAALHARVREHKSLIPTTLEREDGGLYCATRRHHGGWTNALLAAGLNPADHRRADNATLEVSDTRDLPVRQSHGNEVLRLNIPA